MAQVQIDGLAQLRRTLRRLGVDVQDFRNANAEAARVVATEAAARVPKRTGALAGTIRPAEKSATRAIVRAGYARVPYAGPIHWGWPKRHIRASLFITGAAADTEPTWVDKYMRDLEAMVARVTGA